MRIICDLAKEEEVVGKMRGSYFRNINLVGLLVGDEWRRLIGQNRQLYVLVLDRLVNDRLLAPVALVAVRFSVLVAVLMMMVMMVTVTVGVSMMQIVLCLARVRDDGR